MTTLYTYEVHSELYVYMVGAHSKLDAVEIVLLDWGYRTKDMSPVDDDGVGQRHGVPTIRNVLIVAEK